MYRSLFIILCVGLLGKVLRDKEFPMYGVEVSLHLIKKIFILFTVAMNL